MALNVRLSFVPEQTAFVREVILPGLRNGQPVLDHSKCRFALECRPSVIHRWGIFAVENIPKRRRVIEYTGQKIGGKEVWRRIFRQHLYIFWTSKRWALDAGIGGSGAEMINHSCDPNLVARIVNHRIYLSSLRKILAGEELTLDYHLDNSEQKVPCICGAKNCRGFFK